MISSVDCFGFSITDEFGRLDRDFRKLLTEEERKYLESVDNFHFNHEEYNNQLLNEPCIVYQDTVEAPWLVIGISGRFPRSYSEETLIEMVHNAISKSSPMMQSIYKKITEKYEIEFEDLTISGEI